MAKKSISYEEAKDSVGPKWRQYLKPSNLKAEDKRMKKESDRNYKALEKRRKAEAKKLGREHI